MDLLVEEGDEDGEDRDRILEIGIDTYISINVSLRFQREVISQQDLLSNQCRLGTYRLRGRLFCFARAIGLYDFITDSGTGVAREDPASTSTGAADRVACPEALRFEKPNC